MDSVRRDGPDAFGANVAAGGPGRAIRVAFAWAMIALGVIGFALHNFALVWGAVPSWVPGLTALAWVCSAVPLAAGVALLFRRTAATASLVLFAYVALWWLLIKVPHVVEGPLTEMNWLATGMTGILLAGAWTLFADVGGRPFPGDQAGMRLARLLFGLALIPVGLSHFAYTNLTTPLIPSWIPWHPGWAYFTGVCHIAAGLGVLFGVLPRLAALLESVMLGLFTVLVWVPRVIGQPGRPRNWTEFWVSSALTVAAALVAAHVPTGASRTCRAATAGE